MELNRAVAWAWPTAAGGLELLGRARRRPARSAGYAPLHAARAELLRRAGDLAGADTAYRAAIAACANAVEREELARRRAQLSGAEAAGVADR